LSKLYDICPKCGSDLAIAGATLSNHHTDIYICSKCDFYDWSIPRDLKGEEAEEWCSEVSLSVEEKVAEIRKAKGWPLPTCYFSGPAKENLGKKLERVENEILRLCEILNVKKAYVMACRDTIKVEFQ